jgi:hypothetical protein
MADGKFIWRDGHLVAWDEARWIGLTPFPLSTSNVVR